MLKSIASLISIPHWCFRTLYCVGCKCMPNVCYADCHWLVMIITSCSLVLPAECIFTTQTMLKLPKLPEIAMVTLLCLEWVGRDRISSHGLKQSRHNCIILLLPATVSVYLELRIATGSLMKQMTPATVQTERDSICQLIAMKVFPGNHWPSETIICHHSVVSTRSHCQEQWYSALYCSLFQSVWYFSTRILNFQRKGLWCNLMV